MAIRKFSFSLLSFFQLFINIHFALTKARFFFHNLDTSNKKSNKTFYRFVNCHQITFENKNKMQKQIGIFLFFQHAQAHELHKTDSKILVTETA